MARQLLIFGNGLGRAVDNDFFSLDRALKAAWDDQDVLSEDQKRLISRCLPQDLLEIESNSAPTSEDDLDRLQQTLAACDLINELESETAEGWLTEQGKIFPAAIRAYLHRAACEFHFGDHTLPESFAKPLRDYIIETKSHVATLNYDKLLYNNFVGTDVFRGYSCLVDGFTGGRFASTNLDRFNTSKTSYYLHLHGSPLFHDVDNDCFKAHMAETGLVAGDASGHIVLTNVKHKRSVIAASEVLSEYWNCLRSTVISEVSAITILGYSGCDEHLNQIIKTRGSLEPGTQIRIVEREGEGSYSIRKQFWDALFVSVELVQIDNVLNFDDW